MKKTLFSLTILLGIAVLSSCSNQESVNSSSPITNEGIQYSEEYAMLQSKIQTYNESLYPTNNALRRGRKWWQWLLLGASDAFGGICGGLFGGVSASAVVGVAMAADVDQVSFEGEAHFRRSASDSIPDNTNEELVIDNNDFIENYDVNIGLYHNEAIMELYDETEEVQEFSTANQERRIEMVTSALNEACNDSVVFDLSAEEKVIAFNKAETIAELAKTSETLEDFISKLRNHTEALGLSNSEIDVLAEFFNGLAEVIYSDESGDYLNTILHYTDESNLPSDLKVKLGNIMILAHASFNLWGNSNLAF
jgi:hypothetical protein